MQATTTLIEKVTNQFAAQGYTGDDLTKRVCAAGAILAVITKNEEAFAHFVKRVEILEAA